MTLVTTTIILTQKATLLSHELSGTRMDKDIFLFLSDRVETDWNILDDLENKNEHRIWGISVVCLTKRHHILQARVLYSFHTQSERCAVFSSKWTALSVLKITSHTWSDLLIVRLLFLVAQSCPTLCNPMDCSPPGSSVQGDSPGKNTGVGCLALLQGIFPTQGLDQGLPHWRWILYSLNQQGSPRILE